jgi:hypothetical protein
MSLLFCAFAHQPVTLLAGQVVTIFSGLYMMRTPFPQANAAWASILSPSRHIPNAETVIIGRVTALVEQDEVRIETRRHRIETNRNKKQNNPCKLLVSIRPAKITRDYSTSECSDYETMMKEKFGKDLTPHRVKYRTFKR